MKNRKGYAEVVRKRAFTYVDLFAGIGGFHAALGAFGGECVFASEIDTAASQVYESNWGIVPSGDITLDANDLVMNVPPHDVLVAGFPCQPFSKSGAQRGMDETRGTLYWNILKIIRYHQPAMVVLENVRNIAGPRHRHEWEVIIGTLRESGYRCSEFPWVLSPHWLSREEGGRPHARERVFIVAVKTSTKELDVEASLAPRNQLRGHQHHRWSLKSDLPLEVNRPLLQHKITEQQTHWLSAWDDLVRQMSVIFDGPPLPSFPLWGDEWRTPSELSITDDCPIWKRNFLTKNANFYESHFKILDPWTKKWNFYSDDFPTSRRKFEWQAGDLKNLNLTTIQFRPSGIRVKRADYLPALVAITQTSIIYEHKRYISVREAARLQGLPDWFEFGDQSDATSFKQLGNGVSVGAVWFIFKYSAKVFERELREHSVELHRALTESPLSPDELLSEPR